MVVSLLGKRTDLKPSANQTCFSKFPEQATPEEELPVEVRQIDQEDPVLMGHFVQR